jgi:hypothetical protein
LSRHKPRPVIRSVQPAQCCNHKAAFFSRSHGIPLLCLIVCVFNCNTQIPNGKGNRLDFSSFLYYN